jgi:hypothetical protein
MDTLHLFAAGNTIPVRDVHDWRVEFRTVNNNTFCFATTDKVFYYAASVLTTCFGPYIRPSSGDDITRNRMQNPIIKNLERL